MKVVKQDEPVYEVWLTTYTGGYKRYDFYDLDVALKFIEENEDEYVRLSKVVKLHVD